MSEPEVAKHVENLCPCEPLLEAPEGRSDGQKTDAAVEQSIGAAWNDDVLLSCGDRPLAESLTFAKALTANSSFSDFKFLIPLPPIIVDDKFDNSAQFFEGSARLDPAD